jgi:hypothetical protein
MERGDGAGGPLEAAGQRLREQGYPGLRAPPAIRGRGLRAREREARRAALGRHGPAGRCAHALAPRSERQRASSRSSAASSATGDAGAGGEQERRLLAEVLDVRAEQDGLPLGRGLEHVLPAVRHEAAADEHEVGERVDALELADRVDEQRQLLVDALFSGAEARQRCAWIPSPRAARDLRAAAPDAAARGRAAPGRRGTQRAARATSSSSGLVRRAGDEHLRRGAGRDQARELLARATGPSRRPSNFTLPVTHTRSGLCRASPKRRAYSSLCAQKSEMRLNSGSTGGTRGSARGSRA